MAEVTGLVNLERALKALPAEVERKFLRGALRAGAKVIADEARALVPQKSGALRASIRISTKGRGGHVKAEVKAGDKKAWYAHIVHVGAKPHEIKPRKRLSLFFAGIFKEIIKHPGARAQPFMEQAAQNKEQGAIDAISAYLRKRIERFKAKGK